jgi:uncharacterized damage-inducible protein DinB
MQSVGLLTVQTDEAWEVLRDSVEGLTNAEFSWEPVAGCWTIRRSDSGVWEIDYADPAPDPAPFTTIGWRVVHVAACKIMYYEYAFGAGQLAWDELTIPHTATDAIRWLEQAHANLARILATLNDSDLEQSRLTNWGEEWPTWRIFWVLAYHDVQHGAEIASLRHLFRLAGREWDLSLAPRIQHD